MKKLKCLLLIIIMIMLFNFIMPTAVLSLEQIESKEEIIDNAEPIKENDETVEDNKIEETEENDETVEDDKEKIDNEEETIESNNKESEIQVMSEEEFSVSVIVSNYTVESYLRDNIYYLFLPQGVDISNLVINYTGNVTKVSTGTIDANNKIITADFSQNNTITIDANNSSYVVEVLQTDLPSISISLNGVTLSEINFGSKNVKYTGNSITLKTATTSKYDFEDTNAEIKGRGNFSWGLPKKSYQIKLSNKVDVLGMGKAKTWLLIANYGDNSLIRNKLVYDLAQELNLEYTQNSQWIDLWVDGEYQGNYLLVEKVQVGKNRIELNDDYGVIVEMDNNYYKSEKNYFQSNKSKSHFVLKDSVADDEDSANSQSKKAFSEFEKNINEFEKYLYNEEKDWNKISSMIDVESFIKFYFIQEFTENADGARTSVFMYKDGSNDVLHMGPVWDFDLALANCDKDNWGGNTNYDYIMNIQKYMESSMDWYTQLFTIPEFRQEVVKIYNNEIKPVLLTSTQKINTFEKKLTVSSNMNFIKWKTLGKNNAFGSYRGHKVKNTYSEEVKYLSDWVSKRIEYMNNRYSTETNIHKVKYSSHIQNIGWETDFSNWDGQTSGTSGQSKRIEAIKIDLDTFNLQLLENAHIKYQVHVQNYGWMNWKQDGEIAGTIGESKRIEAIKIKLENMEGYTVKYRVHVQNIGWMPWCYNGEIAGTTGQGKRIEAIEIKIVKNPKIEVNYTYNENKNTVIATINSDKKLSNISESLWKSSVDKLVYTKEYNANDIYKVIVEDIDGIKKKIELNINQIVEPISNVKYSSHIQNIGWETNFSKIDGELSGTTGQSKRIEAIKISLGNSEEIEKSGGSIKYQVHVQNIGWMSWKKDGEIAGTTGQGKRIEAIKIKLDGMDNYTVEYQVHIQDKGWSDWYTDGETAGTTGESKRIEAIRIRIVSSL